MRRTLVAVVAVALFVGCSSRGRKHHRSEFYIITNSLPKAYVGQSYSAMVEATGGATPYTWSHQWTQGQPPGIDAVQNGDVLRIAGTPTQAGTYPIVVTVQENGGKQDSKTLWLYVEVPPLQITTTSLPEAVEGQSYSATVEAIGGTGTYTWSYQWGAGGGPAGVNVNAGVDPLEIDGTPQNGTSGTYQLTVTVDDGQDSVTKQFDFVVLPQGSSPLQIVTSTLPDAYDGQSNYSTQLEATGGASTNYTWSLLSGDLPPSLNLNSDGVISGSVDAKASQGSPYTFRVRVSDGSGTAEKDLTIYVYEKLQITTDSLPTGTVGQSYDAYVEATGGKIPYSWTVVPALPSGLQTEVMQDYRLHIYGTPTQAASVDITFTVEDSANPSQTDSKTLHLEIQGGSGQQQTVELAAVADAYVSSEDPTKNYGTETFLVAGRTGFTTTHTYIRFDLSSLPAGATIVSAELLLNVELVGSGAGGPPNPFDFYVCRAGGDWQESSITWNNAPGLGSEIGTISNPQHGIITVTLNTAIVQDWFDNPALNYGLVIAPKWTTGEGSIVVSSKETTGGVVPKLRVTYTQ